jgi:LemA protein
VDGALPAVAVAVVLSVLAAATWSVGWLNGLTGLRRLVAEAWRQVDEELTRRQELIPRFAQAVRRLAPDTAGAVDALLAARERAVRAERAAASADRRRCRVEAEVALSAELARLFAAVDAHPALTADPDVLALSGELRDTEDRIIAGRRHYNDAVRVLDARLHGLAPRLLAPFLDRGPVEPFEAPRAASGALAPDAVPPRA